MTNFIPSDMQQAVFDFVETGTGNGILIAVAGAGKTTTMVEAAKRFDGRSCIVAYNTKMAKELKEKTVGLKQTFCMTFHSAGLTALRRAYEGTFNLELDGKKVLKIMDALEVNDPSLGEYTAVIAKVVSMAKQRGFYIDGCTPNPTLQDWEDMAYHYDLLDALPESADVARMLKGADWVLRKSSTMLDVIDFDDMVYMPLLKRCKFWTYGLVVIDEAQDTNPTRREMAARMMWRESRLIAVGDPHQAIFGFTGADNDSLDQIKARFKCTEMMLTDSFRCPKAVVAQARKLVSHITSVPGAPEGTYKTVDLATAYAEAEPGDAILCRYNKPLVEMCFALIREGKAAKIEGRNIGEGLVKLATRWKIKTIDALENKLEVYLEKEVKKALAKEQEDRADRITDQVATIKVLIDRVREQNGHTVADLRALIEGMFGDNVSNLQDTITLCSQHKSKGLEWDTVYILHRDQHNPSQFARQDWQMAQEVNLEYVAVTRAKSTLIDIV